MDEEGSLLRIGIFFCDSFDISLQSFKRLNRIHLHSDGKDISIAAMVRITSRLKKKKLFH